LQLLLNFYYNTHQFILFRVATGCFDDRRFGLNALAEIKKRGVIANIIRNKNPTRS
jgi:hypothetical protein